MTENVTEISQKINAIFQKMRLGKKTVLLFLTGAVMALSMPPVGWFFVLWFCFPLFFMVLKSAETKKQAFLYGWIFGLGYFLAGLYWVSIALFIDLATWWWVLPLALCAGPAALGLYIGIFALAMRTVFQKFTDVGAVCLFAVFWGGMDLLRGVLFTGFPWNITGYAWSASLPLMQNISWMGVYGLGLVTVFSAILPVLRFCAVDKKYGKYALLASFAAPALLWTAGQYRLQTAPQENTQKTIRVVQANIAQKDKWVPEKQAENLKTYLTLSQEQAEDVDYIIWPETALTADVQAYPEVAGYVRDALPQNSILLTGTLYGTADNLFFNTLMAMQISSGETAYFHKTHLVPFGEYVPFRQFISVGAIGAALSGFGSFTPGDGPYTADVFDIPSFSPLICYEVIFPGNVTAKEDLRPEWILNVTNDGWYRNSAGPYQHFAFTRARAIEEGLPVVRAANTGISAVIDSYGRLVKRLPLETKGIIDAKLPQAAEKTIYARFGNGVFYGLAFFLLILAVFARKTRFNA